MGLYAIGDVQGCASCLSRLLDEIKFDPTIDRLWFVGDLVNRGPDSLGSLRLIRELEDCSVSVLGNHDLHLIAAAYGVAKVKAGDTIQHILDAHDCAELIDWLSHRPLFHVESPFCLVHAGLAPQWSIEGAMRYASEVEHLLQSNQISDFLKHMYGNEPSLWDESLYGWDRLRLITNTFTRIRYCTLEGALQMKEKLAPSESDPSLVPWFEFESRAVDSSTIVFGHWSTLGLRVNQNFISIDTGCVWGGVLTAVKLDDNNKVFQVSCS